MNFDQKTKFAELALAFMPDDVKSLTRLTCEFCGKQAIQFDDDAPIGWGSHPDHDDEGGALLACPDCLREATNENQS